MQVFTVSHCISVYLLSFGNGSSLCGRRKKGSEAEVGWGGGWES